MVLHWYGNIVVERPKTGAFSTAEPRRHSATVGKCDKKYSGRFYFAWRSSDWRRTGQKQIASFSQKFRLISYSNIAEDSRNDTFPHQPGVEKTHNQAYDVRLTPVIAVKRALTMIKETLTNGFF